MMKFSREERNKLIEEIQFFFQEERGEEIGIIAAGKVLDFFKDNLGNTFYNKALDDAKIWFTRRIEDIEIDYDLMYKYK